MQSWMFLSSYESMREKLLDSKTLSNMVHMGNGVMGIAFGTAATVFWNRHIDGYEGNFSYCENNNINEGGTPKQFPVQNKRLITARPDDFKKITGSPVAYWIPKALLTAFKSFPSLRDSVPAKSGQNTGNNALFLRFWYEVSYDNIGFGCTSLSETLQDNPKWFPYNKGGEYKKWYGNFENVINWANDGKAIKEYAVIRNEGKHWSRYIQNLDFMLQEGITWTFISSSYFGARYTPHGHLFDYAGCSAFPNKNELMKTLALFCSSLSTYILSFLNPTLNLQPGNVGNLPFPKLNEDNDRTVTKIAENAVLIAKTDWNNYETSWDFTENPLIRQKQNTLERAFEQWQTQNRATIIEMQRLEEENNRLFIEAYGLQDELSSDAPEAQITLVRADRDKDSKRLIFYAIGCMTGRYSLDESGLIYAHAGNIGFDPDRYHTFPADADGIVPITDEFWFEDDAANRIREFLLAVWNTETLDENIAWLAESLGQKGNEPPQETIRRYIAGSFFKDHLQTYKKRPIYWMFSSGKQGAFQALVYLHRYHESTLSRMRAEYVVPLTGKIQSRIEMLKKDTTVASSIAEKSKLDKDIDKLGKKYVELLAYDEKLRHYADLRIQLDLDDGVKVNYGKFGDLLAEVKAVTGGKGE